MLEQKSLISLPVRSWTVRGALSSSRDLRWWLYFNTSQSCYSWRNSRSKKRTGGVGPDLVRLQLHPAVVGELVREDGHQGDLEDGTAEGLPEARLLLRRAQVAWWRGLGIVAAREGDSEGRSSWSSGSRERAQHCSHHGLLRTDVVSVDLG